jgi:hypothetical protein
MVYGEMAYLTQIKVIGEAAMHSYFGSEVDKGAVAQQLKDAEVEINLDDFKTGNISEIANQKWGDVITPDLAPKEVLEIEIDDQSFKDNDLPLVEWPIATAKWKPAESSDPSAFDTIANKSVGEIMKIGIEPELTNGAVLSRYATYSVIAKFQGKRSSYKALYLFGKDSEGKEVAIPEDLLTSLTGIGSQSFYPVGLLHTHIRETPILVDWMEAHKMTDASCSSVRHVLCCVGTRCGFADADLRYEMSTPLVPEIAHEPAKAGAGLPNN